MDRRGIGDFMNAKLIVYVLLVVGVLILFGIVVGIIKRGFG